VIKPEIDFPDTMDEHDHKVYAKGKEYFQELVQKGVFGTGQGRVPVYLRTNYG
jgi:hypothetical protein